MNDFLKRHNGILTGSFALKCFFPQDEWEADDIDIFLPNAVDEKNKFQGKRREKNDELEKLGWQHVPYSSRGVDEGKNMEGYDLRLPIGTHYKMQKGSTVVNFIEYSGATTSQDVEDLIDKHFDINGCTIRWNGKEWHLTPDISFEFFLDRLWNHREFEFENLSLAQAAVIKERLVKYLNRGFQVRNAKQVLTKLGYKMITVFTAEKMRPEL